jgi:predicted aconitase with swiveling domain
MPQGSTLRSVIIIGLIVMGTAFLSIAVAMQDHFLVFVALMICIGLVCTLFRVKPDDSADDHPRY